MSTDAALDELEPALEQQPVPSSVMKNVLSGTGALGIGVILERAGGFLSNILAARFGGASTFGAYSLAISTANNVTVYAAGGIGSTAIRFSGEYGRDTNGYLTLSRVLALIATVSGLLAAAILWLGAQPLATLVGKPAILPVLRWAAFSAAGILLLECARGFFVGQRRLKAVVLLSATVGIGMVTVLPAASRFGPVAMICGQSAVVLGAVALCLLCYKPLELGAPPHIAGQPAAPFMPVLRRVWSYGFMQAAGLIGLNAAGWWLTSLIAKGDVTMVQMGFFAVAHQFRNVVALVPSLLVEGSFAEMANRSREGESTPDNVMAFCCYVSTLLCLLVAGAGIVVAPWMLMLIYGHAYTAAAAATAFALATSLVHMGSAAAVQRLSVISIKLSGAVNTAWAGFVALAATVLLLHSSTAAKGAAVYLSAHVFSALLVFAILRAKGNLPKGLSLAFSWGAGSIIVLAILSLLRSRLPQYQLTLTLGSVAVWLIGCAVLLLLGKRHHWLPSQEMLQRLSARIPFLRKRSLSNA